MKMLAKILKHQKGAALLTVLPIVAIIASLIYYVKESELYVIQRVGFQVDKQRALGLGYAGESYALDILMLDVQADKEAGNALTPGTVSLGLTSGNYVPDNDSRAEVWAQTGSIKNFLDSNEAGIGFSHELDIIDLDGFFNVNNVHVKTAGGSARYPEQILRNLIRILGVKETNEDADKLAFGIIDWIDADDQTSGKSNRRSETDFYKDLGLPYLPANRQINHISELIYVDGMTDEILDTLSQYIQAYPVFLDKEKSTELFYLKPDVESAPVTPVNINTVDEKVVQAMIISFLGGNVAQTVVPEIMNEQGKFTDKSNQEFGVTTLASILSPYASQIPGNGRNVISALTTNYVSTRSNFYLSQNFVETKDLKFNLLSYIYRKPNAKYNKSDLSSEIFVYQRQLAWNKLDLKK